MRAFSLTHVVVGDVGARQVVVAAHRLVHIFAFAFVRTRTVVDRGVGVEVEGEVIRAPFDFQHFCLAVNAKGDGLVHPRFKGEGTKCQTEGGDVDVNECPVPPVAKAVEHLKRKTTRAVPEAEVCVGHRVIAPALAAHEHAVGVRNAEADLVAPNVGLE